jgi:prophage antirepressor-like protein
MPLVRLQGDREMGQERKYDIQVVNFAYDTNHRLTKVVYRGREAVVATELGRLLGYTNNGSRLVQMITTGRRSWTERFREGIDYEMLQGQDLQDFLEILSHGERVKPRFSHLMILYTSGIHLVLLNTSKSIGTQLHQWLVDEVFPSLKATGSYHLPSLGNKALPPIALFNKEIQAALSKIRNAHIASQKAYAQPRDFAIDWDTTHKAHTAPLFDGCGKTSRQIKAIAQQRGLKVSAHKSARQLMFDMEDFRHANISESAEIDLERVGVERERARQIAITQGQPYFKALIEAGVEQASLEECINSSE